MSELHHQLYGGEISDYMVAARYAERQFEDPQQTDKNIGDIYETQIKGQKAIDTSGIFGTHAIKPAFEPDARNKKLEMQLQQTLQNIAQQLGLNSDNSGVSVDKTIQFKDQTKTDIETANQNVIQAMKELAELKAI